jgi:hypothetical protein
MFVFLLEILEGKGPKPRSFWAVLKKQCAWPQVSKAPLVPHAPATMADTLVPLSALTSSEMAAPDIELKTEQDDMAMQTTADPLPPDPTPIAWSYSTHAAFLNAFP